MQRYGKHILTVLLIISFLLSPVGIKSVSAQETIWVEVDTASEFFNIRNDLTGSYRLMADIDLSAYPNWTPIGSDASRFTGQLDGNGRVIRNLSLNNTSTAYQGLFGVIGAAGKLTNVVVENANITAGNTAGILTGANYGQINISSAKGNISGQDNVGGLVGSNAGQITNAFTQAQVTGKNNVGGLAGSNSGSVQTSYAASTVSPSVLNNYLQFDGLDDFIEIPHQAYYLTDSFTLEAWFQWDNVGTNNTQFIIGKGFEEFEIHTGGDSGINGIRFIPVYRPDTLYSDGRAYQDVYNVIQPGWFHVAVVWDYTTQTARIYINGQQKDIYQMTNNVGPVAPVPLANPSVNPYADNFDDFTIGMRATGDLFFKGKISDVRFWNTVRTSEQIYADKNKQLTGSESGLTGYWKLDENSGTTAYDSTGNHNDGTIYGAVRVQDSGSNFGGLVGLNSGTVSTSYYDSVVSGQTDLGKGSPQTTTAMRTASTYSGWDFTTIWRITEGSSYPYFNRFTLFYSSGANGSLTGISTQTVNPGGMGSAVTAVPNLNFKFDKWSDNLTTATRQDTNVTSSISVSASFLEAVPPTASISVSDTSLILGETSMVTFTFSEAVTGLTTADLTVGSGSLSEPSSSNGGLTWTATLSPGSSVSDATNVITLDNSGVQDLAGNAGSGTTDSNNYAVDTVRPTASISVTDPSLIAGETSAVTFTFSEVISGLTTADLTVGSGSLSEPSSSDGGTTWTATLTPAADTSDSTNVITLDNSGVSDLAGNPGNGTTDSNNYAVNTIHPSVTVEQASGQSDPTNTSPILFTATFSESVTGFSAEDVLFTGSTASGSLTASISGSGPVYTISVSGITGQGIVSASIPADKVTNTAGNGNTASNSTDNQVTYETTAPTVTIQQAAGQSDPINVGPILFTTTFSETVTGFSAEDISFTGSTAAGTLTAVVSGSGPEYTVSVSGMTGSGTVVVSIPANAASDAAGNQSAASTSSDNTVTYDITTPTLTVEQASGQADPTGASPLQFTATFSETVTGFTAEDVSFSGSTAPGTLTAAISGSGPAYTISVSGMTGSGLVMASVAANAASDAAGNQSSASTSTDNRIAYDSALPTAMIAVTDTSLIIGETSEVTFTFSEAISGLTKDDVTVGSGSLSDPYSSDGGVTWTANLTPNLDVTDDSNVISLDNTGVQDTAGNPGSGTTESNNYAVDTQRPTASINVTDTLLISGETSPVTITFSEKVVDFTNADLTVANGTLSSIASDDDGITWTATLTPDTGVSDLTNVITLDNSGVTDLAGNAGSGTTDSNNYAIDTTVLSVTVEQAGDQEDPVNTGPIRFIAVFSEPVSDFSSEDVSFEGSTASGDLTALLTEIDPNDQTTFEISVSGMSGNGTVVASIPANKVVDDSSNPNVASTSADNSVTYDTSSPEVTIPEIQVEYTGSGPASFGVNFNKPVYDPEGDSDPDDVTNPANYLLVNRGENRLLDTVSCAGGLIPDDVRYPITSVQYDSETNTSTIQLASRLPVGTYRLFVCGTTSIVDLAGNPINGGADVIFDFSVQPEPENLPETGFTPGKLTILPIQPATQAYRNSDLILSIPGLGIQTDIVGVPRSKQSWDITWLGNRAGYLYGSAYPTWKGNTVLTGHVWDADNTPGIFADLKLLHYGDQLQIISSGQIFTYEVRENRLFSARSVKQAFEPKEQDWITLITCESFNPEKENYLFRRIVRAVLIEVE